MIGRDDIRFQVSKNLLMNPDEVRRLREKLSGDNKVPNVWSVESLCLVNDRTSKLLASVRCGAGGDVKPDNQEWEGGATNYLVQFPTYVPYCSRCIEYNGPGADLYAQVLRLIHADPLNAAVTASPLGAITMVAAANVYKSDQVMSARDSQVFTGLNAIALKIPKKGGEIHRLIREYLARRPEVSPEDCPAMIIRDFFSSAYAWTCIRSADLRVQDVCAAMLGVTIEIDFVGTPDDADVEHLTYQILSSDGLTCLGGASSQRSLEDTIIACVVMRSKEAVVKTLQGVIDLKPWINDAGGPVTPRELFFARMWDGGVIPWYRAIMNSSSYQYLMDGDGDFKSMKSCAKIERSFYSLIRYNEVADFISDYINNECFNECLSALSIGGAGAVQGYGAALSAVTDDVLACDCGASGHDEVAEFGMGLCLWMLLVPRYQVWKQLHAFSSGHDKVSSVYSVLPASHRLQSVLASLSPGNVLHTPSWQPLWKNSSPAKDDQSMSALIAELARRIVRRSLLRELYNRVSHHACETIARSLLHSCHTLDGRSDLCALSTRWIDLFDACLRIHEVDAAAHRDLISALQALLRRIWESVVTTDAQAADNTDKLFFDFDPVIRKTYSLPVSTGLALRRVFFGVTSGAIELCGFNPYTRLTDGVAKMCATQGHA